MAGRPKKEVYAEVIPTNSSVLQVENLEQQDCPDTENPKYEQTVWSKLDCTTQYLNTPTGIVLRGVQGHMCFIAGVTYRDEKFSRI